MPPPPEEALRTSHRVERPDLDMLAHVNNAVYVDYVDEAVAQSLASAGWPPNRLEEYELAVVNRGIHIRYQNPPTWGDRLDLTAYVLEVRESGAASFVSIQRS